MDKVVLETNLEGAKLLFRGKVRDIYDLDDRLLIVATDRISAFDYILPTGIPNKGKVLTQLSAYWFDQMKSIVKNHLISVDIRKFPAELQKYSDILAGRSMLTVKAKRIDVECVVRGYISGSAWEEYKKSGSSCGIKLPAGLAESDKLSEPIFTPAIKAASGHDVNVSEDKVAELLGWDLTASLRETSIRIYERAAKSAESKGIIIADTKFEFGLIDNDVILIDELLTPDSSRFWSKADYRAGVSQKSFDKQFVRDYLKGIKWDMEPPAPPLPGDIVEKTAEKYRQAYERLTGKRL
jgi:phosphoribosylaminoimidazole-succinocarboxamide synthase